MLTKLKPELAIEQYELLPLLEKLQYLGIEWEGDMQTGQVYLQFSDGRIEFHNLLLLKAFVTGCIKMMEYPQHLNSKIELLEQHYQDYVQLQQELIPEIAQNCNSFIQEIHALRLLIYRGAREGRKYLLTLQVNQRKSL
ncbi:hypothetical protein [Nostoc sp.]|uniref:hypothetical protein n=1 Tax=Nostoc sp. TaxID=1180 RepID=UPI002FF6CE47